MVIWSPQARADLKAIHNYIAKDSAQNTKQVIREIKSKADSLAPLPYLGKTIPEFERDDLREIHVYSWRVLYQVNENNIYIIAVVHKRRMLETENTPGTKNLR